MNDYPLMGYIKEQPEVLKKITDMRKDLSALFVDNYVNERPDRIYLFGSGTSLNALKAAAPFMQKILGIEVECFASSQLMKTEIFAVRPLFCGVSQEGASTNTIRAIEKFRSYPMIAVTADEKETIAAEYSEIHTLLQCGEEEAGPKTKGYTAIIMSFYLYALEAGLASGSIGQEEYDGYIGMLYTVCDTLLGNIEKTIEWYEAHSAEMKEKEYCVIWGKNVQQRLILESALKMMETVRFPVVSYEFEEYLHGPMMAGDNRMLMLGMIPFDEDRKRALDLIKYFRNKVTDCAFAITDEECEGLLDSLVLDMPDDEYMAVFAQSLPAQVISSELPTLKGTGYDDDYFMEIDAVVGTKDYKEG